MKKQRKKIIKRIAVGLLSAAMMFQYIGEVAIPVSASGPLKVNTPEVNTQNETSSNPFCDVTEKDWYFNYAVYALNNSIMSGKGTDEKGLIKFDPLNNVTRAEFVQILYNKEGKPDVDITNRFEDVKENAWFAKAISWAAANDIVAGKGDIFDTKGSITRQEIATILCKYAKNFLHYDTEGRADLDAFEDQNRISSWALEYMKWAVHYGIMKGKGTLVDPLSPASRAEAATMVKNFIDAYAKAEDEQDDQDHEYHDGTALISINGFENNDEYITTQSKISLSGKSQCEEGIEQIICKTKSLANTKTKTWQVNGKEQWSVDDITLDIGTNYISVIMKNATGEEYLKEVRVIRNSTEVQVVDNVVAFDVSDPQQMEEVKQVYLQILDTWHDDHGTEDTKDDEICLAVKETNPLYQYILSGDVVENDIVFIPENDYFIGGYTMIYRSHDDNCGDHIKEYEPSKHEVIHIQEAGLMDLIGEDFCLNLSEVDSEDPIAFIYNPYVDISDVDDPEVLTADSNDGHSVTRRGIQYLNLSKIEAKAENDGVGFGMNIVLFDKDGKEDTENDRIEVEGGISVRGISPHINMEWHPIENANILPDRMQAIIEYDEEDSLKVTFGSGLLGKVQIDGDSGDGNEDSDSDDDEKFTGKRHDLMGGFLKELEGVEVENTIFLGAIGYHIGSGISAKGINRIAKASGKSVFEIKPILVLSLILDIDGEIKIDVSVQYKEESHVIKGIDIIRSGAQGQVPFKTEGNGISAFTVNVPNTDESYNVFKYNVAQKSEKETGVPKRDITLTAEGKAEAYAGFGIGVGLMAYGIMPIFLKGTVGPYLLVDADGSLIWSNYPQDHLMTFGDDYFAITGKFDVKLKLRGRVTASARFYANTKIGAVNFELTGDLINRDLITILDLNTVRRSGQILKNDFDGDQSNDEPIRGATVKLEGIGLLSGRKYTAITNKDGKFEFSWLNASNVQPSASTSLFAKGKYKLTIEADGYEPYIDPEFKIGDDEWDIDKLYLEKHYDKEYDYVCFDSTTDLKKDTKYRNCRIKRLVILGDGMIPGEDPLVGSLIEKVEISDKVTKIPQGLFRNVIIKEISIPDNVVEVEKSAFSNAKLPEDFKLGNGIKTYREYAFDNAYLADVKIVIDEDMVFGAWAFRGTTISEMELVSGTNVRLTSDMSAFNNATIKWVTISDDAKVIPSALFAGADIRRILIPENIRRIESYAFHKAKVPFYFTIGKDVKYIGKRAFAEMELPSVVTFGEGLALEDEAFYLTTFKEIRLVSDDVTISSSKCSPLWASNVKKVAISEDVTKIPAKLFSGAKIEEIVIPDNIETVEYGAFWNTKFPEGFKLGEGIHTFRAYAFAGTELDELVLDENSVLNSFAFMGGRIGTLYLNGVAKVDTYDHSFGGRVIGKVVIADDLTVIQNDIFYAATIESITIPSNITEIGSRAFESATLPEDFTVPAGVKVAKNAFAGSNYAYVEPNDDMH